MSVKLPSNKLKHPISKLIKSLQNLPEGTTYETSEEIFWGCEAPKVDLGTSYQYTINIVEGFSPPRS